MKQTTTSLRLMRIVAALAVVFTLWEASTFALNQSFAQAISNFGVACMMLSFAVHPSQFFGPAIPTVEYLESHPLPKTARRFVYVGIVLIAVGMIWRALT